MWANGRWSARVPIGDIGQGMSPFPFVLTLGQDDNERILGKNLATLGAAVEWNTELVSLEQLPTHVHAGLKGPDGAHREITATWVAGCDGSHSAVRKMCGIGFPGDAYEHTFFVADTEVTGPMKPGELNVYLWRDGFHLFFPMRGQDRWRVIGILPKELRARDDVTFERLAPSVRQQTGAAIDFKSCSWFSTYRIYHRAAERFRNGRCFLLGDAAHVHSPMGGQGMNTGLQDAYNLAWKLALVIEGRAETALLDTYEQERMPVARKLLETTDRAFQVLVADNWFASILRTRLIGKIAARAMTFPRARKLAFRTLSQTGISYPASSLSRNLPGLPKGAPAAGDRFPWVRLKLESGGQSVDLFDQLDDTRFNLLVFGQPSNLGPLAGEIDDLVYIHTFPEDPSNQAARDTVRIPQPSFYLLRPDGHVGLCGPRLDMEAVRQYLAEHACLKNQDTPRHMRSIQPEPLRVAPSP